MYYYLFLEINVSTKLDFKTPFKNVRFNLYVKNIYTIEADCNQKMLKRNTHFLKQVNQFSSK